MRSVELEFKLDTKKINQITECQIRSDYALCKMWNRKMKRNQTTADTRTSQQEKCFRCTVFELSMGVVYSLPNLMLVCQNHGSNSRCYEVREGHLSRPVCDAIYPRLKSQVDMHWLKCVKFKFSPKIRPCSTWSLKGHRVALLIGACCVSVTTQVYSADKRNLNRALC